MKRTLTKTLAIFAVIAMCFSLAVPAFAASFPDYQSYYYNKTVDTDKAFSIYVKGDTSSSKTGMTIGINEFGSGTAVAFKVYNNATNKKLASFEAYADYLWTGDQVVLNLPSCETYRVEFNVIPFPDNTNGRAMVWTY